ncbi:LEA14-like dessication related protein [Haloarcula vallismortis]|uniref:Membrane protein NosY n=2 Tax=Haloarcula vallismortis TaxID=28442 RepID=M0J2D3_HALVA|nr:LEA type 2 family protein [Haloarcula vallismortis]EMA01895.1 membrane protein NosY precursor [Haloarcula vallismortis ATCC 29715]SDW51720.1 LEA14-like dessication related protein [Haloarcula vallismortis]
MGRLKIVGVLVVVAAAAVGGSVALGVLGAPSVTSVDNHFAGVSNQTTAVATNLTVNNPNPVGVQLGGVAINYTISMNGVEMAQGAKEGVGVGTGNTTLPFSTEMQNDRIPPWWVTHIDNGETTTVGIDATVTSSALGGRSVSASQARTIETDLLGQFNSSETRPVEANQPLVSDPVLYINETRGAWDQENLTQSETPMNLAFDVYNPKPYPYTVTKVGYTIRMNDVTVGEGETDRGYILSPGQETTLEANTAIQNENLDRWWVTHLQRNQRTDLYIDFYLVLEGGGEQFRVDLDSIDYQQEIETDIFGNKAQYPTGDEAANNSGDGAASSTTDGESTATPTPSDTETETDDGLLGSEDTETDDGLLDGSETETATDTATPTPTESVAGTETATPTETETDDGGLLG